MGYGIKIPGKLFLDYAELSVASYAILANGGTVDSINELMRDGNGLSEQQAEKFAEKYTEIVTQFNSITTGFSATVFRDNEIDNNLILAFRGTGTDVFSDLFPTDFHIGLVGAGFDQITDMYSWWLRESSASTVEVAQYRINYYEVENDPQPENVLVILFDDSELGATTRNGHWR